MSEHTAQQEVATASNSVVADEMERFNGIDLDVLNVGASIDEDTLSNIKTMEHASEYLGATGSALEDLKEYGTGFVLLEDKDRLVSTAFAILEWRFNKGENGTFVTVYAITDDGNKFIFNDGSSGVCRQLFRITEKRVERGEANPRRGIYCSYGLRKNTYNRKDDPSKTATTYHLA